MPEMGFFMMPDHAASILRDAMVRFGSQLFTERRDDGFYELTPSSSFQAQSRRDFERYALQASTVVRATELRPFVQIWLPVLENGTLYMSSIGISKNYNHDYDRLYLQNMNLYSDIRRYICGFLDMGTMATNQKTKKSGIYKYIGIDRDLNDEEIILKQDSGNLVFCRTI